MREIGAFSHEDLSDIICLLHPLSVVAHEELRRTESPHIVRQDSTGTCAIVQRLSLRGNHSGRRFSWVDVDVEGAPFLRPGATNAPIEDGVIPATRSSISDMGLKLSDCTMITVRGPTEGSEMDLLVQIPQRNTEQEADYRKNVQKHMNGRGAEYEDELLGSTVRTVGEDLTAQSLSSFNISRSGAELDGTSAATPGYAESVFSRAVSETSVTTQSSLSYIKSGQEVLLEFILEEPELNSLFVTAAADQNIGAERLERNLRRLLATYSKELLTLAESGVQREAAKLVRISTAFVSHCVRMHYDASWDDGLNSVLLTKTDEEHKAVTEERLNQFLETLEAAVGPVADPNTVTMPRTEVEHSNDMDSDQDDGDGLDDVYDEETIHGALAQVRRFLRTGAPLANLKKGLKNFVLPGHLPEAEQAPAAGPTKEATGSGDEEGAKAPNQASKFIGIRMLAAINIDVDALCDLPALVDLLFDVLPFAVAEPPIPKGARRIRWKCVSCNI